MYDESTKSLILSAHVSIKPAFCHKVPLPSVKIALDTHTIREEARNEDKSPGPVVGIQHFLVILPVHPGVISPSDADQHSNFPRSAE